MVEERRLELHYKLCSLLGDDHVYFQPPESVKLVYPCIVYHVATGSSIYANNEMYKFDRNYELTYIDRNPDHDMIEKMQHAFAYCRYDRRYVSENLYHDAFSLYW